MPLEPKPLEPDQVWTAEEWAEYELTRWADMPPGEELTWLKHQAFVGMYSGGHTRFIPTESPTGRFRGTSMPKMGDKIHLDLERYLRGER